VEGCGGGALWMGCAEMYATVMSMWFPEGVKGEEGGQEIMEGIV